MIGNLDLDQKKVLVVGAGIGGLLIAHRLAELGFEVEIVDAENRVGGLIQTADTPYGLTESAAHSIRAHEDIQKYFEKLGLRLLPLNEWARARYIFREGKRRKFPLRFLEIIRTLLRAYLVLSNARIKTLEDWCLRHLGKPALEYGLNPFIRGVYAARPAELNLDMVFPSLRVQPGHSLFSQLVFKRRKKSPRAQICVIEGGTEQLIKGLRQKLESLGVVIRLGHPQIELPTDTNIVLSVPTLSMAQMLRSTDVQSAQALEGVPYSPLVSVTVFVSDSELGDHSPQGVGVLIPEKEGGECLGVLFNSASFLGRSKKGFQSFTFMYGGTAHPEVLSWKDSEFAESISKNFERLFLIRPRLQSIAVHRWPRAIPIYGDALQLAWNSLLQGWCLQRGHVVFSNCSGQVSIRGMIETILSITSKPSLKTV